MDNLTSEVGEPVGFYGKAIATVLVVAAVSVGTYLVWPSGNETPTPAGTQDISSDEPTTGFYELCDKEQDIDDPTRHSLFILINTKPFIDAGQPLPRAVRYNNADYVAISGITEAQKEETIDVENDYVIGTGCPKSATSTDCMAHVISSDTEHVDGNLLLDGAVEPSCSQKSGTLCISPATYGDHYGWIKSTLSKNMKDITSEVVYDGKVVYKGENIGSLALYKDHIIYTEKKNSDPIEKNIGYLYYDGKNMGTYDVSNGYTLNDIFGGAMNFVFGDHIAQYDSNFNFIIDGNKLDYAVHSFYGLGDRTSIETSVSTIPRPYNLSIVDGKTGYGETLIFGNNTATYTMVGDSTDYAISFNGNLIKIPEFIPLREKVSAETEAWKNPKTPKEIFFKEGGVRGRDMTLWGNKLAFSISGENGIAEEHAIYYDGKIIPLSENEHVGLIKLFGNNILYTTYVNYDTDNAKLYYNGSKIAESKKAFINIQLFGNHYAYMDGQTYHLFYDGKDMGEVSGYGIYEDHLYYSFKNNKGEEMVNYDGKLYKDYPNLSIGRSMAACTKGYIEDVATGKR